MVPYVYTELQHSSKPEGYLQGIFVEAGYNRLLRLLQMSRDAVPERYYVESILPVYSVKLSIEEL
jgi:hypothetical protein